MGVALAEAAMAGGHQIKVVHGPLSVDIPEGGEWIPVERAVEMMEQLALNMEWADVLIMSAAVCDMRPVISEDNKKLDKGALHQLNLFPNPDIVGVLASRFPEVHVVSFSLENDLSTQRPLEKMRSKKSHWAVVNALDSMGADRSTFAIIDRKGEQILKPTSLSKVELARSLMTRLSQHV
jgi:phosphopantothenoylcysteine synthetase/decarboxylase